MDKNTNCQFCKEQWIKGLWSTAILQSKRWLDVGSTQAIFKQLHNLGVINNKIKR